MRALTLTVLLSTTASWCGRGVAPGPLAVGDTVDGTLTADDTDAYHGVTADVVAVRHDGASPIALVVTSATMEPFAIVAVRGAPAGADAGEAGGAGACVVIDAPHPLDLLLYVSSAGGAPHGDYRVSVEPATDDVVARHGCEPGAPPGPPEPGPTLTQGSPTAPAPAAPPPLVSG